MFIQFGPIDFAKQVIQGCEVDVDKNLQPCVAVCCFETQLLQPVFQLLFGFDRSAEDEHPKLSTAITSKRQR